jgi:diketogulonate reductase-like aldo/keto reductase
MRKERMAENLTVFDFQLDEETWREFLRWTPTPAASFHTAIQPS